MDSYIIRIYRRDIEKPEVMLGIVEATGDETQRSFRSRDELWELLAGAPRSDKKSRLKTSKVSG